LKASILRHEHYIALRLGLQSGMRVLDAGCGVGGPMRAIARFSGANVVGVNISRYQIERARMHTRRERMEPLCEFVEANFSKTPFSEDTFGAAYAIEACCHAADRREPFAEIFRVLKPGALFAGYEWCMTGRFDANNPDHERIKHGIEKGNSLPSLVRIEEVDQALRETGFDLLETHDLASSSDAETPWYAPLEANFSSLSGFRSSSVGIFATHQLVRVLEALHLSPQGTVQAHDVLRVAQRSLLAGGKLGIFTPMYFFLAQKPSRP
jgi:sterol 24-C-methyltransferase